jgi:probable HAF family extracellular repeat protein
MRYIATPVADGSGAGINDQEWIVGKTGSTTASERAYLANADGMVLIPVDGYNSQATAIGNDNEVVGTVTTPDRRSIQGWKYEGGQVSIIPGLGGTTVMPRGTNGTTIVGQARKANLSAVAFAHTAGVTNDLGTLGGRGSIAYAINAAGLIVGSSSIAGTTGVVMHACKWENNAIVDLHAGAGQSWAYAVNDSGVIAGQATVNGNNVPVRFDAGQIVPLSGTQGLALGINNAGVIVGSLGNPGVAFVFRDGKLVDLNTVTAGADGWSLMSATDINNDGVIVVTALKGSAFKTFQLVPEA